MSELVTAHSSQSSADDVDWLHVLVGDWQLLADLAFADIVLWVPTADDGFVAVAHARPSSAATLFYRDFVGQRDQAGVARSRSPRRSRPSRSSTPPRPTGTRRRRRACAPCPVLRRLAASGAATAEHPIAVHHPPHQPQRGAHAEPAGAHLQRLRRTTCSRMIASGDFPDLGAPTGPRRGAPRASDGLIRLDVDGVTTFASPNALSAFNRMGFAGELEGESLAEVTTRPAHRQASTSTSRCRSWSPAGRRGAPTSRRGRHGLAARHPDPQPRASASARSCSAAT